VYVCIYIYICTYIRVFLSVDYLMAPIACQAYKQGYQTLLDSRKPRAHVAASAGAVAGTIMYSGSLHATGRTLTEFEIFQR
jgi:hypothetical protein